MHLFPLQSFSDRFGVDLSVVDFRVAIERSSIAAAQDVASRFRLGPLGSYGSRRDFFWVDKMSRQGTGNLAEFYLSRPFVQGTFTAFYTPSPINVRNGSADSYTDISNTANDGLSNHGALDADRGIYNVFGLNLSEQWVVITYSGGLIPTLHLSLRMCLNGWLRLLWHRPL